MDNDIKSIKFKRKYIYIKGKDWEYRILRDSVVDCSIESYIEPPNPNITSFDTKRNMKLKFVLEWDGLKWRKIMDIIEGI